jgi:hypothetical protein
MSSADLLVKYGDFRCALDHHLAVDGAYAREFLRYFALL